ncbi:unnamed protein product [Brachionus calyciflorus]|uniref:Uncharacterized protein n=1 Tax=Brachionus calyciflorus TaxID=104777 RepID=A0A813MCB4_9BILA|nr:unnamed protein product [Brachionus calyciflorus]
MANKFCIIATIIIFHFNVIYLTLLASIMITYYTQVYNSTTNSSCSSSNGVKNFIFNEISCISALDCSTINGSAICLNGKCYF